MNFEKRVYEQEFYLNDTDDTIIDYIKLHRKDIPNLSIQNIAKDLFISPNAIMRMAKKLGYSGFSELKFSLQKEHNPTELDTVEKRVLDKLPQNIIKSFDMIDEKSLKDFIDDIIKSKKILFAGIGDSTYFCESFGRNLRCANKKVEYFHQIHDIEYASKSYTDRDLVIIISASGQIERLIRLAEKVKKQGSLVYCITHFGNNPLNEVCDKQLCFWGERHIVHGYNVTDRSGLMMLINLICEEYWSINY